MPRVRGPAIDLAIGFLIPYAALAVFLVLFQSNFEIGQIAFSFVLPILLLIFPFASLPYNPAGVGVLLLIAGAFYAIFRWVPPTYRRYAAALVFAAWGFYGFYCARWVAV